MADVSANTISTEAKEEMNRSATDQNQDPNPNPIDMRICITGGAGGLFSAAAPRIAGALAPKATIKKTPKADIF